LLCAFLVGCSGNNGSNIVAPSMVGHWKGNARIIVSWCQHTNLVVELDIRENGSVEGTIGDAKLIGGRLKPNRGWLGRKLNLYSDWIIVGNLQGAIVSADGITRGGVKIPLEYKNNVIMGGINTSGASWGKNMALTADNLKLVQTK